MRLHCLGGALLSCCSVPTLACGAGESMDAVPAASEAGGKADDNSSGATGPAADAHQDAMLSCVDRLLAAQTDQDFAAALIPAHGCLERLNDRATQTSPAFADLTKEVEKFRWEHRNFASKLGFVWDRHAASTGASTAVRMDYVWAIRSELDFSAWVVDVLAEDGQGSDKLSNEWWSADGRVVPKSLQKCLDHLDDTFYPLSDADACIDEVGAAWREELRAFLTSIGQGAHPALVALIDGPVSAAAKLCEAQTGDDPSRCKVELKVSVWSRVAEFLTLAEVLEDELPD